MMKFMKKNKKMILWPLAILLLLFMFSSFSVGEADGTSITDLILLFLYRISVFIMFTIWEIGIIFELNVFHIQEKPLFSTIFRKKILHVLSWILLLFISIQPFSVISSIRDNVQDKRAEKNIQAIEQTQAKQNPEKKEEIKEQEQTQEIKEQAQEAETESAGNESGFGWKELAKDKHRYKQVIMLLGENFLAGEVNDTLREGLTPDEIALVEDLYDYCSIHSELPKDLQDSFTEFCTNDYEDMYYEDNSEYDFYDAVSKGFQVSWKTSDRTFYISLYEIPEEDYSPDRQYLDAERYVDNGCVLYICEDGSYKEYATVENVMYGVEIDDVCYGFAIKLDFVDDELDVEEYKDGDWFFNIVRGDDGSPKYFVSVNDLNRRGQANNIDYESLWNWKQLKDAKNIRELDVFMGAGSCKRFQFTIVDIKIMSDYMLVRYPNGNEEVKSYWAMTSNKALYVIE